MLQRDGIAANSFMGRHLLQKSHPNSGNNYNAYSAYSINDVYEETPFTLPAGALLQRPQQQLIK